MSIQRLTVAGFVLAVVCLSAAGPDGGALAAHQTPAAPTQQPTFRSKVDLIAVDVEVVDSEGRPVVALAPDKFTVTIDHRRRRVVSADFISFESPRAAGAASADHYPTATGSTLRIPPRVTVLAIDCLSFNVAVSRSVIQAAREFVMRTPADVRLGLFTFPIGPKVDPSTDRAPLLRVLDTIVGQRDEPTTNRFRLRPSEIVDLGPWSTGMGDLPEWAVDMCPPQDCQLEYEVKSLNLYYEALARSSLNVFRSLLRDMRDWPGRKTVVLASAGMVTTDRPGGRPDLAGLDIDIGHEAALSNVGVYTLFMDQSSIETNAAETRRGRKTITDVQRDSNLMGKWLDQFSGAAGGSMIKVMFGNGAFAFDRVMRETSAYYLLGVVPERDDRDGRTHEINVKVSQPRVSVHGRAWVSIPASATATATPAPRASSLSSPLSTPAARPAISAELTSMMTAFDRGDDEAVFRGVTQSPDHARLLREYRTVSPLWRDTPRREAIFALDLALAVLRTRNTATREDAARLILEQDLAVRGGAAADAFECQWYITQTAAIEGLLQPDLASVLVRQARQRCPAEARLALADGVLTEQGWAFSAPVAVPGQPAPALDPAQVAEALAAYTAAAQSPALAEEARVRAAWLEYRTGQIIRARALLSQNQPAPRDPRVRYLSSLVTGHVLRGQQQFDLAAAAYRDAMAAYPGAQSARVALMTLLVAHGSREESESLAGLVQTATSETFDPWWTFWLGEYPAYRSLLAELRRMAR